jgi:penicillin-binding protein 1C
MLTFSRSRVMTDFPFRVAVKTGTSTFFRDLWAVGYTPDYTVAVWVGNFDGLPTKNLSGSTAAAPIFSDIMTWLYRQSEPVAFRRPKGVKRVEVCGYSGMRPTEYCVHTVSELFIAGTEPKDTCTFHKANKKRHELSAPFAGWLYSKNRTDSSGRFRLSGFGDDLSKVFQDPWEGVALEREPGIRPRNIKIARAALAPQGREEQLEERHYSIGNASGVVAVNETPSGDGEIKIIYPLDHDRFVMDRSDQGQMIKLQAVVAQPVQYVEWFVNGDLYKRTGPPYQAVWKLEEGRFRITAVTPENAGDSVQVTVE